MPRVLTIERDAATALMAILKRTRFLHPSFETQLAPWEFASSGPRACSARSRNEFISQTTDWRPDSILAERVLGLEPITPKVPTLKSNFRER